MSACCIISFLYIKPQLKSSPVKYFTLYYIVSLHQTTTAIARVMNSIGCIISFLYIKPQQDIVHYRLAVCCIISFLYIKPQLVQLSECQDGRCIISFLYIKPQHVLAYIKLRIGCIISFLYIKPQL